MGQPCRKLKVWQRAKLFAVAIYKLTSIAPLAADYGLRDQLRRAAVRICRNIAEGDARQTDKTWFTRSREGREGLWESTCHATACLRKYTSPFASFAASREAIR